MRFHFIFEMSGPRFLSIHDDFSYLNSDVYRCGPSPLEAIRRGEVGVGFDTPFIFAEVNADVCHFVRDPTAPWGFKKSKLNEYQYVLNSLSLGS